MIPWLILDMATTILRLIKNPWQFLANRRVNRPSSSLSEEGLQRALAASSAFGWDHHGDGLPKWVSVMGPSTTFCQMSILSFMGNRMTSGRICPGFNITNAEWPDSCPSVTFNTTAWRRRGEDIPTYRLRVVREFEEEETRFMDMQPQYIEDMVGGSVIEIPRLTRREIDSLKVITFQEVPISATGADSNDTLDAVSLGLVDADGKEIGTAPANNTSSTQMGRKSGESLRVPLQPRPRSIKVPVYRNGNNDIELTEMRPHAAGATGSQISSGIVVMSPVPSLHDVDLSNDFADSPVSGGLDAFPAPAITAPAVPLPPTILDPTTGKTTDSTCALCLEDYTQGEQLRELACTHRYHLECIDQWLTGPAGKRTCPVCNADALLGKSHAFLLERYRRRRAARERARLAAERRISTAPAVSLEMDHVDLEDGRFGGNGMRNHARGGLSGF